MHAVATHTHRPQSKDKAEIIKMILIAAITLVLMAFATSGSSAATAQDPRAPSAVFTQ